MGKAGLILSALVARQSREGNAQTAILYRDTALSFAELDRLGRKLARAFSDLGVRRGDRVAVWLPNVPAWHICLLACSRLGATVVAINTRFRSAELSQILGKAEPRVLVLWPDFRGIDFVPSLADCEKSALSSIDSYVCYSEADADASRILGRPAYGWREVLDKPEFDQDHGDPESGCVIFSTSGTSSAPKLALHTQVSISRHALDTVRAFGYDAPDATILVATPMCGTSGFGMAAAALAAGRPQVVSPIFDEAETADLIRQHQVTHTHATHHILRRLFAAVQDNRMLQSLRLVNCGTGAPLMVEPAAKRGICVIGIYGSTEVQARFSRQDECLPLRERAVGGGMPISGDAMVRARCLESGRILPHGDDGELEMNGPSRLARYLGDAAINRRAFTDDGFVRTGDLGHTLPDGRFVFVSRIGDILRLSGFLVSPAQIEHVIEQHPAVGVCQVVGVETANGLRPFAFVQIREGQAFDERLLTDYCRRKMAPYKTPAAFHRLDEFPVTEGANQTKVQKVRLREMARALLASGSHGAGNK